MSEFIIRKFELAWQRGERPVIAHFLEHGSGQDSVLPELVRIDLEFRIKAGESPSVDQYQEQFPTFFSDHPDFVEVLLNDRKRLAEQRLVADSASAIDQSLSTVLHDQISVAAKLVPPMPEMIGRYRVERLLGKGGFGVVYLGIDEQLGRKVAIKVPHADVIAKTADTSTYLKEARTVANLDHPHIVPVHDVGSAPEFPFFVVSKFVDGGDLACRMKRSRLSAIQSAELVARIADALHYAHKQGLVHRDIKPGNILINNQGEAFLVDFGLALRDDDIGNGPGYCGTPAYMSPEQARGEGHRVDGRSDIFSLGVVFYELLCGQRPFKASDTPSLFRQIAHDDPRPIRQYDETISKELERICFKALSKRTSERYATAFDLGKDLRHFLEHSLQSQSFASDSSAENRAVIETSRAVDTPVATPASDSALLKIVPKGLRSFDAHDADFFLELLPGPRDRNGLPDSIRFWKTRIEEFDADQTFSVGMIYGPSGCGKSSLVKAALIPHLSKDITTIYVEATAEQTETRLLNGLRKHCHELSADLGLKESLGFLRRGKRISAGKKVLIILDQFEQWLHARKDEANTELVDSLRQCDGSQVQCIVMVRDDFWMAATRFMRELDSRLLEGHNSSPVDLFDLDHARKVLGAFGRAFGKLPASVAEISGEQREFLKQSSSGLAQEGKVIPVRLSLFAEMMKGKPWTLSSLKEVGGTEGVGVAFLEETFSVATAPPEHRYHQKAARTVLKALLPEVGTSIKGHMRSYPELLEDSGYSKRPNDFDDLIRILDSELRLITPTDPEGLDDATVTLAGAKYYQLTHDYLVPSLSEWLTRKQKETRRGRAELLLADQAAVWNARPQNSRLPTLLQLFQIELLTTTKKWTQPQKKMMGKAERFYAGRLIAVATLLIIGAIAWLDYSSKEREKAIPETRKEAVARWLTIIYASDISGIPNIADVLHSKQNPFWKDKKFWEMLDTALPNVPYPYNQDTLRYNLFRLRGDKRQIQELALGMLRAGQKEFIAIRGALLYTMDGYAIQNVSQQLWVRLENPKNDLKERFRAACALASFAEDDPRWEKVAPEVAAMLISQNPDEIPQWKDAFSNVGKWLMPALEDLLMDEKLSLPETKLIASVYGSYASSTPDGYARLQNFVDEKIGTTSEAQIDIVKRKARIAVTLLLTGKEGEFRLLMHQRDPTIRSFLIEWLGPMGIDPVMLISSLEQMHDVSIKRAILLSLGEYGLNYLSHDKRLNLLPRLLEIFRDDPDPGLHGAAEWLLRQWGQEDNLVSINGQLHSEKMGHRQWYVTRQGQTMVIAPTPDEFWMGDSENRQKRSISHRFAIAAKEVTVDDILKFPRDNKYFSLQRDVAKVTCPVRNVSWYDAAAYCNWVSAREGIPVDEWCYLPNDAGDYASGMKLAPNQLQRTGYRLPTVAEWEYACRAGSETAYSFGESEEILVKYAWFDFNSRSEVHPVGLLKPNDLGLWDMHGNVSEWTQDVFKTHPVTETEVDNELDPLPIRNFNNRVCRGGSYDHKPSDVCSSSLDDSEKLGAPPDIAHIGFRIARTLPGHANVGSPNTLDAGVTENQEK